MKKNILICHIHMKTGGIETSLINLLSSLDSNKYNIDLLLFYPNGELLELIPDWVNIIPIWKVNGNDNHLYKKIITSKNIIIRVIKNIIFNPFFAKSFIPKKDYDFAFAYAGYSNFIDTVAGKTNAKQKFIWIHADFYTQCNIDPTFNRKFKSIYKKYKLFDKILCVSKTAANNFIKMCPELSSKVTYQWNINKERKISNSNNNNIKLDKNTFTIIAIARLAKYKGIERLVDTAKLLKNNNFKFKIYVLGDGPNRTYIEEKIRNLNLESDFILLGNVINVFPIIKQADLYVSPSDCEGFSSVTLESLLCGIPIVATPTASSIDIYTEIAPEGSMLLTKDFTSESISSSILLAKDKLSKSFTIDINSINNNILKSFEKRLEN